MKKMQRRIDGAYNRIDEDRKRIEEDRKRIEEDRKRIDELENELRIHKQMINSQIGQDKYQELYKI